MTCQGGSAYLWGRGCDLPLVEGVLTSRGEECDLPLREGVLTSTRLTSSGG